MAESGEEITLLPYDYDISDKGAEKTKVGADDDGTGNGEKSADNTGQAGRDGEGNLLPVDETQDGDNVTAPQVDESQDGDNVAVPQVDKSEEGEGEFDSGHSHDEQAGHGIPPSPEAEVGQPTEPAEPEEPKQYERSKTPPAPPHPESHVPQPNLDPPAAPIHPYQPQPNAELPEFHHEHQPQPIPAPAGSELCQVIATGMNTEMQQYASLLASEALTQFPNHTMAIARHIMMNFEQRYGPPWCCAVSNGQLGFYLRYDRQNYIYFALSRHTIFLYKSFTS